MAFRFQGVRVCTPNIMLLHTLLGFVETKNESITAFGLRLHEAFTKLPSFCNLKKLLQVNYIILQDYTKQPITNLINFITS